MTTQRKSGREVAEQLVDFMNSASLKEIDEFVTEVTTSHRYLQGETFRLFFKCMKEWDSNYRNNNYDPRNESACLLSHRFMELLD
jgi:hypothetical protein